MNDNQINTLLKSNEDRLNDTYLHFLASLLRTQVLNIAKTYNFTSITKINQFVLEKYLIDSVFSEQEINKIQEYLD